MWNKLTTADVLAAKVVKSASRTGDKVSTIIFLFNSTKLYFGKYFYTVDIGISSHFCIIGTA